MTTMIREVYEALKEAGASEEKAIKAAKALASYESRPDTVETDLTLLNRISPPVGLAPILVITVRGETYVQTINPKATPA